LGRRDDGRDQKSNLKISKTRIKPRNILNFVDKLKYFISMAGEYPPASRLSDNSSGINGKIVLKA
jgi:hypothetical protein